MTSIRLDAFVVCAILEEGGRWKLRSTVLDAHLRRILIPIVANEIPAVGCTYHRCRQAILLRILTMSGALLPSLLIPVNGLVRITKVIQTNIRSICSALISVHTHPNNAILNRVQTNILDLAAFDTDVVWERIVLPKVGPGLGRV